jgi:hypothetical protein
MKDRNRVNRFCDPVTGHPFLYQKPTNAVEAISPKTIILATADPIPSNQGDVYFAVLANMKIEWSVHPLKPGDQFAK